VNSTDGELRIPITKGIAGHVASTGEALIIDNAYSDDRFNPANDVKTGFRTDNMICVPLKEKKGNVIGVVQLINKDTSGVFSRWQARSADSSRPSFTQQDMQFLEVFASQAATAVANSGDMPCETQASRQKQNDVDCDEEQPLEKPLRRVSFTKISLPTCFEDVDAAKPSSTAADDSVVTTTIGRKKSGRARQRTAKWWASVRRKTPSPEPVKELRWCHTNSI
jgi:hypothetical protein